MYRGLKNRKGEQSSKQKKSKKKRKKKNGKGSSTQRELLPPDSAPPRTATSTHLCHAGPALLEPPSIAPTGCSLVRSSLLRASNLLSTASPPLSLQPPPAPPGASLFHHRRGAAPETHASRFPGPCSRATVAARSCSRPAGSRVRHIQLAQTSGSRLHGPLQPPARNDASNNRCSCRPASRTQPRSSSRIAALARRIPAFPIHRRFLALSPQIRRRNVPEIPCPNCWRSRSRLQVPILLCVMFSSF